MSTAVMPAPPPWKPSGSIPQPRRWTPAEFNRMGELGRFEGRRAFLLDGIIWEQGPMEPPHTNAIELLTEAVRSAFGSGWRFRIQTLFTWMSSTTRCRILRLLLADRATTRIARRRPLWWSKCRIPRSTWT